MKNNFNDNKEYIKENKPNNLSFEYDVDLNAIISVTELESNNKFKIKHAKTSDFNLKFKDNYIEIFEKNYDLENNETLKQNYNFAKIQDRLDLASYVVNKILEITPAVKQCYNYNTKFVQFLNLQNPIGFSGFNYVKKYSFKENTKEYIVIKHNRTKGVKVEDEFLVYKDILPFLKEKQIMNINILYYYLLCDCPDNILDKAKNKFICETLLSETVGNKTISLEEFLMFNSKKYAYNPNNPEATDDSKTFWIQFLFEMMYTIGVLELKMNFFHGDIKRDNILIYPFKLGKKPQFWKYTIIFPDNKQTEFYIENKGYMFVLFDYGLSRTYVHKTTFQNQDFAYIDMRNIINTFFPQNEFQIFEHGIKEIHNNNVAIWKDPKFETYTKVGLDLLKDLNPFVVPPKKESIQATKLIQEYFKNSFLKENESKKYNLSLNLNINNIQLRNDKLIIKPDNEKQLISTKNLIDSYIKDKPKIFEEIKNGIEFIKFFFLDNNYKIKPEYFRFLGNPEELYNQDFEILDEITVKL